MHYRGISGDCYNRDIHDYHGKNGPVVSLTMVKISMFVTSGDDLRLQKTGLTRMRGKAQRDGRPAVELIETQVLLIQLWTTAS